MNRLPTTDLHTGLIRLRISQLLPRRIITDQVHRQKGLRHHLPQGPRILPTHLLPEVPRSVRVIHLLQSGALTNPHRHSLQGVMISRPIRLHQEQMKTPGVIMTGQVIRLPQGATAIEVTAARVIHHHLPAEAVEDHQVVEIHPEEAAVLQVVAAIHQVGEAIVHQEVEGNI